MLKFAFPIISCEESGQDRCLIITSFAPLESGFSASSRELLWALLLGMPVRFPAAGHVTASPCA